MRQVKEKSFWAVFGVATVLTMAGCATGPTFDSDARLDPVRPFTNESSEASKLLANFEGVGLNSTALTYVVDKALWEDEIDLDKGGFDPIDVNRALGREKPSLEIIKKYGTVPVVLRDWLEITRDPNAPGVGTIAMNSMLMNSNWTTLGHTGLGIGLGTLFTWVSSPDTPAEKMQKKNEGKLVGLYNTWFMFPLPNQYASEYSQACHSIFSDECERFNDEGKKRATDEARQIAMGTFTQAAVNLGFKPVGTPGQTTLKKGVKAIYQMLENDALGCPKVVDGTFSLDNCRVTFRDDDFTQISPDFTRAAVLVTPRRQVGLAVPCVSDEAKVAALKNQLIQGAIKLSPGTMAYVAPEKVNGKWTPQKVMDARGDHYFVVPVKRTK